MKIQQDECVDTVEIEPDTHYGTTRWSNPTGMVSACDTDDVSPDVWYRYTPSMSGPVTVSLCGTGPPFDALVSVTTDCGSPQLFEVACSSEYPNCGPFGNQGRLTFQAAAGTTYFIRISNDSGGWGDYEMLLCEGTDRECERPPRKIRRAPGPPRPGGTITP